MTSLRLRRILSGVVFFAAVAIVQLVVFFAWAVALEAWDASYSAGWLR